MYNLPFTVAHEPPQVYQYHDHKEDDDTNDDLKDDAQGRHHTVTGSSDQTGFSGKHQSNCKRFIDIKDSLIFRRIEDQDNNKNRA